ncbi:MAG: hypothetical protein Q8R12_04475 [bacterium]|nr:hypothetical protein [bacterium]
MRTSLLTKSLLVVILVFSWGCSVGPMTPLGTASGGAIGYAVGGPTGAAAGAGIGMLGGAAADMMLYGPDVFRPGEAQAKRQTEANERIERDRVLANLPCTLGEKGEVSYTANSKEVIKMNSNVEKGIPCQKPYGQTSERLGQDPRAILAANGCYTFPPYVGMYRRGEISSNC